MKRAAASRESILAKAGTQASTREVLPVWQRRLRMALRGLCLADSWVPAFAGIEPEDRPGA